MFGRYKLGDHDEMFRRFFDRWYDDAQRVRKGCHGTRPDLLNQSEHKGRSAIELSPLTEDGIRGVTSHLQAMVQAAEGDWATFLSLRPPIDIRWLIACDEYFVVRRVTELAKTSDPSDFSNPYIVTVCEFGAVLGSEMRKLLPRLEWVPSLPYWESDLFDPVTGALVPIFHWAIKKFSTYGIDDGFNAKMHACVLMMRNEFREEHA